MKNCARCQRRLHYAQFNSKKDTRDGFANECKSCAAARSAAYRAAKASDIAIQRAKFRAANRELLAARTREYQDRHREETRARNRSAYYANIEERKAKHRAWHKANADALRPYYAEKTRRRFAALRRATPAWADRNKILEIYEQCRDISEATGIKHHVDHIVPLVSPLICGLHVEWNLQIIPATDNLTKSNKLKVE